MQTPRISALTDCENRMRRDWQAFAEVWQRTADSWRDHRRRQFEEEHLREVPPAFTRVQAELNQFRDTLQRALSALGDRENE